MLKNENEYHLDQILLNLFLVSPMDFISFLPTDFLQQIVFIEKPARASFAYDVREEIRVDAFQKCQAFLIPFLQEQTKRVTLARGVNPGDPTLHYKASAGDICKILGSLKRANIDHQATHIGKAARVSFKRAAGLVTPNETPCNGQFYDPVELIPGDAIKIRVSDMRICRLGTPTLTLQLTCL